MKHNQRGLTLVEVLASLAVLSVIGLLLWNVLFQGLSYSRKAASQTSLQQEANRISMKLTRIHQTTSSYEVVNNGCNLEVYTSEPEDRQLLTAFSDEQICYNASLDESSDHAKELELTIHTKDAPEETFTIHTVLYKLKGSSNHEN
ncbi:PulJ/GspJ family protein [Lysinibacillus sphaericus]